MKYGLEYSNNSIVLLSLILTCFIKYFEKITCKIPCILLFSSLNDFIISLRIVSADKGLAFWLSKRNNLQSFSFSTTTNG